MKCTYTFGAGLCSDTSTSPRGKRKRRRRRRRRRENETTARDENNKNNNSETKRRRRTSCLSGATPHHRRIRTRAKNGTVRLGRCVAVNRETEETLRAGLFRRRLSGGDRAPVARRSRQRCCRFHAQLPGQKQFQREDGKLGNVKRKSAEKCGAEMRVDERGNERRGEMREGRRGKSFAKD